MTHPDSLTSAPTVLAANVWLHRFAILLAVCTLLLISAGGMVTSTGSGLSVPDWPTSYGYNMFTFPVSQWKGGIVYEHTHRLIASTVGFLTIILAIWLQLREPRRWLRRLGWLALLAVILQGVLGGLTVIFLLPTPVSVLHACLAQTFFCIVLTIAMFTSPRFLRTDRTIETSSRAAIPALCKVLVGCVFAQLILGAIMRHTDSGLAVTDFPLAYGQLFPRLSESAVESYNHHRRWDLWMQPVSAWQIGWHMAHRAGAVIVAFLTILTAATVLRRHGSLKQLRRPAILLLCLLSAQIGLGAWVIWSGKAAIVATAHVAVGAGILGTAWVLTLRASRLLIIAPASLHSAAIPAGAAA